MTQKPLTISLVIPACNEERYLAACLTAALTQELPFCEIIVVDNGSSDRTADIARWFGVKVISEPQPGIVFARDAGFNAAKGDIIARIDADTFLPTDWSQRLATFYAAPAHAATAWTSGGHFDDVPASWLASWLYHLITFRVNRWLTGYASLWGSSMALPRRLWQGVRQDICAQTGIHEDLDLATHLIAQGSNVFVDPDVLVRAKLRRVWQDRHQLWDYLQWWPRTLRQHHQKAWVICWAIGVLPLYIATGLFPISDFFTGRKRVQVPAALET